MTIEHNTTHGPHGAGQLAADWMLESGKSKGEGGWAQVHTIIRLAVPAHDQDLDLKSAAALKDALVVHLRNMGWDDPDTRPAPDLPPESLDALRAKLAGGRPIHVHASGVVEVAQAIKDAYAENARTIGEEDARRFTPEEAGEILQGLKGHGNLYRSEEGILYTRAAADLLREMAGTEADLASPVAMTTGDIHSRVVRNWTDEQCRGAWNHAMENTPRPGRLTDRPTGRVYSPLGADALRARLNEINGADAVRD